MSKVGIFINWIKIQFYKLQSSDSTLRGILYGKFYVIYPDGKKSINMYYNVARDYASIFGGDVLCTITHPKREQETNT